MFESNHIVSTRVALFSNEFEPLSVENAKYFAGLTHDAALKIYETTHGLMEGSEFKTAWGNLVKRKFGPEILSRKRCRGRKGAISYSKLQPKDPTLWNYLFPSYVINNLSTVQNGITDSESADLSCLSVPQEVEVQGSSVTINDDSASVNQQNDAATSTRPIDDSVLDDFSCYDHHLATEKTNIEPAPEDTSVDDEDYEVISEEDDEYCNSEDEEAANSDQDEVYPSDEEATPEPVTPSQDAPHKKAKTQPLFSDLPPLNSKEMHDYSKEQLRNAPSWIRNWLEAKGFAAGLNLDDFEPHFITADIRKELQENGFAVIKGVFDIDLLKEATRYIQIKQRSERIGQYSYRKLCRKRYAVGLVTKNGWTKTDYAGYAQQVITTSPNLYKCLSELYGTSRLFPNLYEYKYNYGRSSNNGKHFEFVHSDVNYSQLLFAEQVGLPVDGMYQFITPLTPMSPEATTVYVSKGFNRHWKAATYRAMKAGHWTRHGWKSCHPYKQFLPEDVENLIKPSLTPLRADPGDLVIFSATLPHGPNENSTYVIRIAAYPYLAPYLIGRETSNDRSYLPNGVDSIQNSIRFSACPKYSAHAAGNYQLSLISRHFFPCLPYRELWRWLLGDCLFGFKSWKEFEDSEFAKLLFGPPSPEQNMFLKFVHLSMTLDLRSWNNEMDQLLNVHERHPFRTSTNGSHCTLCNRMAQASLEQWWHSTDAVYHRLRGCDCKRCEAVKGFGWRHWKESGGCTCPLCVNNK